MNHEQSLDLDLPEADQTPAFPWPVATNNPGPPSSSAGIHQAMTWPGLTPSERCVAIFVGDGYGGPGNEASLARRLEVDHAALEEMLWSLLRKGFLQAVAAWWSR